MTITDPTEMNEIVETLQSMKLHKTSPNDKDGYAFLIELHDEGDEPSRVVITSKDIVFNSQYYKCDKDYCDDFQNCMISLRNNSCAFPEGFISYEDISKNFLRHKKIYNRQCAADD